MKAGFNWHGIGGHFDVLPNEAKAAALPMLMIAVTAGHVYWFAYKHAKMLKSKLNIEEENAKSQNDIEKEKIKSTNRIIETAEKIRQEKDAEMALYKYKEEQKQAASSNEEVSVNEVNAEEYLPTLCKYDDAFGNDVPLEYIIDPYVTAGNINVLLGGAGVCKSMAMVQMALAASTGKKTALTSENSMAHPRMNTIFCRCEEYSGEFSQKYGKGKVLKDSGIKFMSKSTMKNPTMKGLLDGMNALAMTLTKDTFICIDSVSNFADYNPGILMSSLTTVIESAKERGIIITFLVSSHYEELENHKPLDTTKIVGGDEIIRKAGSVFAFRHERTGEHFRFIQVLKEPKGTFLSKSEVFVEKINVTKIDDENWFAHLEYVGKKEMANALPFKIKPEEDDNDCEASKNTRSKKLEWTEEMNNRLRELAKKEKSQRGIARALTKEFEDYLEGKVIHAPQVKTRAKELNIKLPTKD